MAPPYETAFAIRNNFAVGAVGWTDLVGVAFLPIPCSLIIVYNNSAVDVLMRTDPNNAASQITIQSGQSYEIGAPSRAGTPSFQPGSTHPVASFQSTSGSINLLIESIL